MGYKIEDKANGKINITVVKGDVFIHNIKIYTEDRLLYVPGENDVITFSIWNKYTDEEPLFEKVLDYNDTTFVLTSEESNSFRYGKYLYSVKIVFADGAVDTFLTGQFNIVEAGGDL